MSLTREQIESLIFGRDRQRRFTQDSPVLPDVWLEYANDPAKPVDLLLTPYRDRRPSELYVELRKRLQQSNGSPRAGRRVQRRRRGTWDLTLNESYVVTRLTLRELVRAALPLTKWWAQYVWPEPRRFDPGLSSRREEQTIAEVEKGRAAAPKDASPHEKLRARIKLLQSDSMTARLADLLHDRKGTPVTSRPRSATTARATPAFDPTGDLLWMIDIVGTLLAAAEGPLGTGRAAARRVARAFQKLIRGLEVDDLPARPLLWSVSCNRRARLAVWRSTLAVKADAARRVFKLSCKGLRWAVLDTGIDATHPAFRRRQTEPDGPLFGAPVSPRGENQTRVVKTYDFTSLRERLDPDRPLRKARGGTTRFDREDRERAKAFGKVRERVAQGLMLDWQELGNVLEIPMDRNYAQRHVPRNPHGTHVAGTLAADWRLSDGVPDAYDVFGMCPDLELVDVRVLDDNGEADEFTILAALQFIRYLNSVSGKPIVQGVNLSMSLHHDVMNYACGRTPVCDECQRLVGSGTVVVAAAGNEGHSSFLTTAGNKANYRASSITDPGNAEGVITVGATHRNRPHSYGISYFSSRGPTGDGRVKPDLVAPGEKITAPVPGDSLETLDGTSMAAPHVSGAAALLMARYDELIGDPSRIKQILCSTATDLKREPFFQGKGMLDTLRALQAV